MILIDFGARFFRNGQIVHRTLTCKNIFKISLTHVTKLRYFSLFFNFQDIFYLVNSKGVKKTYSVNLHPIEQNLSILFSSLEKDYLDFSVLYEDPE